MRKIVWLIVVLALVAGAWFMFHSDGHDSDGADGKSSGSGHKGAGGKSSMVPVGVATAKTGDISVYLDGLGNITPPATVVVHTLITGQLMHIAFTEGQMVKQNDLLAQIDDRPYVAALEQAEGLLKRDKALLDEAKLDLARYQELWKKDSIAKQQLDTQGSLVKQYEGTVTNDQGQVDNAKVNLVYTKITSPVGGRVGLRQVDEGNIVHTTDSNGLVVVTQLQPITSIFTIPEDDIPQVLKRVNAGEQLEAQAWDRDNKTKLATGTLIAVDNQVDPTTGTVKFRAQFANEDLSLFPSQFVNIRLKLQTLNNVVLIPTSAVQRGTHGTFVYKVTDTPPPKKEDGDDKDKTKSADEKPAEDKSADDKGGNGKPAKYVTVQNITLGPSEGEVVSVQKGVSAGDTLVVDGADSLRDGAKIEIASADNKPANGNKGGTTDNADGKVTTPDNGNSGKHHHHKKKHSDDAGQ